MKTFPPGSSVVLTAFLDELTLTFRVDKSPINACTFTMPEGFPETFSIFEVSSLTVDEVMVELSSTSLSNLGMPSGDLRSSLESFLGAARPYSGDNTNYKQDSGKLDYTLLMNDLQPQVEAVVKVLHWGHHTKGYPRQGYKALPGGTDRLTAACYRHMAAMAEDFWAKDDESGQPHVVHAVANLLMAMAKTPEGES